MSLWRVKRHTDFFFLKAASFLSIFSVDIYYNWYKLKKKVSYKHLRKYAMYFQTKINSTDRTIDQ